MEQGDVEVLRSKSERYANIFKLFPFNLDSTILISELSIDDDEVKLLKLLIPSM